MSISRASLSDPWLVLRLLVDTLIAVFGAPARIARAALSKSRRASLAGWLRASETWTRKRLLLLARALPETKALRRPRAAFPLTRPWGRGGFADENSAAWGVSFRLSQPAPRARSFRKRRARGLAPRPRTAMPLAERLEALSRVAANPARYVRRQARLLRRARITPHALASRDAPRAAISDAKENAADMSRRRSISEKALALNRQAAAWRSPAIHSSCAPSSNPPSSCKSRAGSAR